MAKYGEKILHQLANAAREFAKNRTALDCINEERIEIAKTISLTREEGIGKGIKQGKLLVIRELADSFNDLDELYSSDNSSSEIVKSLLINNGYKKHNDLFKGNKISITQENRVELESIAKFDGLGEFEVIKSAFILERNIERKAELVKITNE